MKVDFTGRGVEIEDRIKEFTHGKLERLKKHFDEIHDLTVILSTEKYRHKAEINFLSQKRSFHGAEESSDMYQSIDRAIDKVETQVKKFKQKQMTKKRHTTETIRANGMETEEHARKLTGNNEVKVIRSKNNVVKPMSLEEAVEELEKLNQEFIIFRNAETEMVNVVYHRRDGNVGLIESPN